MVGSSVRAGTGPGPPPGVSMGSEKVISAILTTTLGKSNHPEGCHPCPSPVHSGLSDVGGPA